MVDDKKKMIDFFSNTSGSRLWKWIVKPKEQKGFIREWTETIIFVLLMWLIITEFVVQNFYIPSSSMETTFLINDRIFVNRFIYRFTDVKRNDIIVFKFPHDTLYPFPENNFFKIPFLPFFINKKHTEFKDIFKYYIPRDFIKRAIGMPGDIVEIKNKKVFINGIEEKLEAAKNMQAIMIKPRDFFGPVNVPKNGDTIYFSKLNLFELYCIEKYFLSKKIRFEYNLKFEVDEKIFFNSPIINTDYNESSTKISSFHLAHEKLSLLEFNHKVNFFASEFKIGGLPAQKYTFMEDCFFALGDNRDNSHDSRFWGYVPQSFIKGTPIIIYWPLTRMRINFNPN